MQTKNIQQKEMHKMSVIELLIGYLYIYLILYPNELKKCFIIIIIHL